MTDSEFAAALKKGEISGIYIFCGEEAYLKRHYVRELRKALLPDPAFDAFNHAVFEGAKIDYTALLGAVEAPPMMADKKLVEWHMADFNAMRDTGKTDAKAKEFGRFTEFLAAAREYPETVVLFVVDAEDIDLGQLPKRPSKLYTALAAEANVVVFEKASEAKLGAWVLRHFAAEGIRADSTVAAALLSRSGHSMDALTGEVAKLAAYLHAVGRDVATPADVEEVCAVNSEEDAFGLTNAVIEGNAPLAYRHLRDMKLRKVEPTVALASVTRVFADLYLVSALAADGVGQKEIATRLKMHEYKAGLYIRSAQKRSPESLREALELSRRADLRAKSVVGSDAYLLLEYLIAETLTKK